MARTDSLAGWLHGSPFQLATATVEIHARQSPAGGGDGETGGGPAFDGLGTSSPAPPPPPPPLITVAIEQLDCRGIYVDGLRTSLGRGDAAPSPAAPSPELTVSFDAVGFSCAVGRLDVRQGALPDTAPDLSLRLTGETVALLGSLDVLTPVSRVGINANRPADQSAETKLGRLEGVRADICSACVRAKLALHLTRRCSPAPGVEFGRSRALGNGAVPTVPACNLPRASASATRPLALSARVPSRARRRDPCDLSLSPRVLSPPASPDPSRSRSRRAAPADFPRESRCRPRQSRYRRGGSPSTSRPTTSSRTF